MGVKARVVLYSQGPDQAQAHAQAAFERLNQLDASLSDYRVDSELARFLKGSPGEYQPVSHDFAVALRRSEEIRRRSSGAFHIGVGALVKLWREARRSGTLPAPEAIAAARPPTSDPGYAVDPVQDRAALLRSGTAIDFGGIGKGYAAQETVDLLRSRGATRCLVALAGDIVAGEPPPGARGWEVAIARSSREPPFAVVLLAGRAISTSGDTEQYVEIGGTRYAHIVDPRTGEALRTAACATVLALRGEDADAWASALCVLAARGEPVPDLAGDALDGAAWIVDTGGDEHARVIRNEPAWRAAGLTWTPRDATRPRPAPGADEPVMPRSSP